jgi:hypothetical protein
MYYFQIWFYFLKAMEPLNPEREEKSKIVKITLDGKSGKAQGRD